MTDDIEQLDAGAGLGAAAAKPSLARRWFLREYSVVVLGVLTALALEQAAEWVHWRNEVAATRRALNEEVAGNLGSAELQVRLSECVAGRLDELERWHAGWREGRPPALLRDIAGQPGVIMPTSVWSVTTGGEAAKLPLALRNSYATFYELVALFQAVRDAQAEVWYEMFQISYLTAPGQADLDRFRADIEALRGSNTVWAVNMTGFRSHARRLGVDRADPVGAMLDDIEQTNTGFKASIEEAVATFCTPILAE